MAETTFADGWMAGFLAALDFVVPDSDCKLHAGEPDGHWNRLIYPDELPNCTRCDAQQILRRKDKSMAKDRRRRGETIGVVRGREVVRAGALFCISGESHWCPPSFFRKYASELRERAAVFEEAAALIESSIEANEDVLSSPNVEPEQEIEHG